MLNSKEEARLEAYRRLRDDALASEKAAREAAAAADERAKAALEEAEAARAELESTKAKLDDAKLAAKVYSDQATRLANDADGARADVLATTKRAILDELVIQYAGERIERLGDALKRLSRWPATHSSEAKAMRELAVKALREDEQSRRRVQNPST